jgi:FG-GAP repeat protein
MTIRSVHAARTLAATLRCCVCLLVLLAAGAVPAAAQVELMGMTVVDSALPNTNNDGRAEPGEYFYLQLWVLNMGSSTITPTGSLQYTGSLDGVVVWDGASTFHPILPGMIYYNSNQPFQIRLRGTLACGLVLPFHLAMYGTGADPYETDFTITLGGPKTYDLVASPSIRVDQSEATFWGAPAGSAGRSVVFGDFNGDGLKDAVIASPAAGVSGRPLAGIAFIVFGRRDTRGDTDLAPQADTHRRGGSDRQPGDRAGRRRPERRRPRRADPGGFRGRRARRRIMPGERGGGPMRLRGHLRRLRPGRIPAHHRPPEPRGGRPPVRPERR